MKTTILNIIFLSIFSIATFAQNSITLNTDNFTSFETSQALDIYLHQSDSSYIQLKGTNVDIEKVDLQNKNGHLKIQVQGANNINSKIHIYSSDYKRISISGASSLHTIGQIKGDRLKMDNR